MVPQGLAPRWVQGVWEGFANVEAPLAGLFPAVNAGGPGNHITYDVVAYGRERGQVNTRTGPANSVAAPSTGIADVMGETWREKIIIGAETLKDLREPGQTTQNRAEGEVVRSIQQLKNRHQRFLEWLRAEALQGIKSFYAPGTATEIQELLLCSDACIMAEVAYDWSTAPAGTEATARATLAAIQADFQVAGLALAAAGCTLSNALMNSTTCGYLNANAIIAGLGSGYDYLATQVAQQGHVKRAWGVDIVLDDEVYVHPITGALTNYIPDNVVVFYDSDNTRAGRQIIECEALHVDAPAGTYGIYFAEPEKLAEGSGLTPLGEWTGQPVVANPCSEYVLQDVTNENGV